MSAETVPQGRHADKFGGIVGGRRHTLSAVQHPLRSLRMPEHDHLPSSAPTYLFLIKISPDVIGHIPSMLTYPDGIRDATTLQTL